MNADPTPPINADLFGDEQGVLPPRHVLGRGAAAGMPCHLLINEADSFVLSSAGPARMVPGMREDWDATIKHRARMIGVDFALSGGDATVQAWVTPMGEVRFRKISDPVPAQRAFVGGLDVSRSHPGAVKEIMKRIAAGIYGRP
jgi:hypothetical protein